MTSEERFIYLQLITIFQLKPVVKHCQRSFLLYRLITPTKLFYVITVFRQYFLNYKIFYHSSGNAFLLLYRFMFVYCNFHCHFDLMRKTLIKFFMIFNQLKYITLQLSLYQFLLLKYILFYHSQMLLFIKILRYFSFQLFFFLCQCNYCESTKFCWYLFKRVSTWSGKSGESGKVSEPLSVLAKVS